MSFQSDPLGVAGPSDRERDIRSGRRRKCIIVLQALLSGQTVKFPNDFREYSIQDDIFGVPLEQIVRTGENAKKIIKNLHGQVEFDLSHFIQRCEDLSWDYVTELAMNTTMNVIKDKLSCDRDMEK